MLKIRKSDVVIATAFLAFLFAWHHRASFIEIGLVAAQTDALLAEECR